MSKKIGSSNKWKTEARNAPRSSASSGQLDLEQRSTPLAASGADMPSGSLYD
jgi:hypothetical protein